MVLPKKKKYGKFDFLCDSYLRIVRVYIICAIP